MESLSKLLVKFCNSKLGEKNKKVVYGTPSLIGTQFELIRKKRLIPKHNQGLLGWTPYIQGTPCRIVLLSSTLSPLGYPGYDFHNYKNGPTCACTFAHCTKQIFCRYSLFCGIDVSTSVYDRSVQF